MNSAKPPEQAIDYLIIARKQREPWGLAFSIVGFSAVLCIFHLFAGYFGVIEPYAQRLIALTLIMVLGFLLNPLGRKSWRDKLNPLFVIDIILILITISVAVYVLYDVEAYRIRVAIPTRADIVVGTIGILLILELTRRCIGWSMVVICMLLFLQLLTAEHLVGFLRGPLVPWDWIVTVNFHQTFGVFGIVMRVFTEYLILFLIFSALLLETGAGKFFVEFAILVAGRYSGGIAKVAVVSSCLFGTVSGSSVANVATTGSFTIPAMISAGYKRHFAGAVEAAASTGGQIMPPVMGAAAFLIAEFMGISYFEVALAALIPAIFYFAAIFMMVHLEAKKLNLAGVPKSDLPTLRPILSKSWVFLMPVAILFYFMIIGYGLATSVMYCIIVLFALSMIKKETRSSPLTLLRAFERAANMAVPVGIAMACAGLLIGTFHLSGLGDMLASMIVTIAGNNLYIALIATAVVSLILGMGIPTTIVYVMVYMFAIPALIKMGANPLAANLFAFYYGIISTITPPVALTAFAAAALAGSPMMRTGWTASRLAIAGYIAPFMFVLAPSLVLQGPILYTILNSSTAMIGVFCVAIAFEGWYLGRVNGIERTLYLIAGVGLIIPEITVSVAGIVLFGVLSIEHKLRIKRAMRRQMIIARSPDSYQR